MLHFISHELLEPRVAVWMRLATKKEHDIVLYLIRLLAGIHLDIMVQLWCGNS